MPIQRDDAFVFQDGRLLRSGHLIAHAPLVIQRVARIDFAQRVGVAMMLGVILLNLRHNLRGILADALLNMLLPEINRCLCQQPDHKLYPPVASREMLARMQPKKMDGRAQQPWQGKQPRHKRVMHGKTCG